MESTSNVTTAPVRGTVISAGDDSKFKKGQDIFFRRFSTDILKIMTKDGEKEVILVEDVDILAIIKDNNK
jgi:co-chaperonin GroES (HSP10)